MATSVSDGKAKPSAGSKLRPRFHAGWDIKPRQTLVSVRTDSGLEGHGSGDRRAFGG